MSQTNDKQNYLFPTHGKQVTGGHKWKSTLKGNHRLFVSLILNKNLTELCRLDVHGASRETKQLLPRNFEACIASYF